jgi:hypothetical protein
MASEEASRRQRLLRNLRHETYCRIARSDVSGVGVIAIRDIPPHTNPFYTAQPVPMRPEGAVQLSVAEMDTLPRAVTRLVGDFIKSEIDGSYIVPVDGLNSINISFYMNHSDHPNCDVVTDDKESLYCTFRTRRAVRCGEELTFNYHAFDSVAASREGGSERDTRPAPQRPTDWSPLSASSSATGHAAYASDCATADKSRPDTKPLSW